jgi:hypothetical protein
LSDAFEEYNSRVSEYTDAPEVFIQGSFYYLVSATQGEFYQNPMTPPGAQRPNEFIMFSSIPGRTRRSTVQRLAYKMYKDVIGDDALAS